jgi:hypothetical protein
VHLSFLSVNKIEFCRVCEVYNDFPLNCGIYIVKYAFKVLKYSIVYIVE